MGRIDVLGWPLRSPNWVQTLLLIGLITFIPIVGSINLYGWMMTCVDNLRAGRGDLPPAGFYLSRGWRLYVVYLVYQVVALAVFAVLFVALFAVTGAASGAGSSPSRAVVGLLAIGSILLYGFLFLAVLSLQGLLPLLGIATDHFDVGGALNPMVVIGWIQARPRPSLIAMLLSIAAQFIAQLGVYLCFVGIILSLPFGFAMLAGVIRNLELDLAEARS